MAHDPLQGLGVDGAQGLAAVGPHEVLAPQPVLQAAHEGVAGADRVLDDDVGVGRDLQADAGGGQGQRAPLAAGDDDDGGAHRQPGLEDLLHGGVVGVVHPVEPADVLVGALDQVRQGDEGLDGGARVLGLAHELRTGVGVVADGGGGPVGLQDAVDRLGAGGEDRGDGAGVDQDGGRGLGQGGEGRVPVEVEEVGGAAFLVDGGLRRRGPLGAVGAGDQAHARGLQVLAHGQAALVAPDPAVELGVAAQSRQAERHIGGGAAGDVPGRLAGVDDDVDEGLADDECGSIAAGCGHGGLPSRIRSGGSVLGVGVRGLLTGDGGQAVARLVQP